MYITHYNGGKQVTEILHTRQINANLVPKTTRNILNMETVYCIGIAAFLVNFIIQYFS